MTNWRKLQTRTTSDGRRHVNPFVPMRLKRIALARSIESPAGDRIDLPPLPPELFINRELSWLEFNRRVLDEAKDERLPLKLRSI